MSQKQATETHPLKMSVHPFSHLFSCHMFDLIQKCDISRDKIKKSIVIQGSRRHFSQFQKRSSDSLIFAPQTKSEAFFGGYLLSARYFCFISFEGIFKRYVSNHCLALSLTWQFSPGLQTCFYVKIKIPNLMNLILLLNLILRKH